MQTLGGRAGVGVAVSSWRLARAVSSPGHLGVVSGTALDVAAVLGDRAAYSAANVVTCLTVGS